MAASFLASAHNATYWLRQQISELQDETSSSYATPGFGIELRKDRAGRVYVVDSAKFRKVSRAKAVALINAAAKARDNAALQLEREKVRTHGGPVHDGVLTPGQFAHKLEENSVCYRMASDATKVAFLRWAAINLPMHVSKIGPSEFWWRVDLCWSAFEHGVRAGRRPEVTL